MAYATGRCMCHQMLRIPFSEGDVHAMVRKVFAYRCEFHDGTDELAPGITVHKIGGHSKGLQCVRVKTKRGYVVVASDCIHFTRTSTRAASFRSPTASAIRWRVTRQSRSSLVAPAHRAGARSGGTEALSGRKVRIGELDRAARC